MRQRRSGGSQAREAAGFLDPLAVGPTRRINGGPFRKCGDAGSDDLRLFRPYHREYKDSVRLDFCLHYEGRLAKPLFP